MYLPPKKKREKMGVREPRPEFRRHKAFVRGFPCAVPGCRNRIVQFAHLRSAANAGTGLKPLDCFGVPLCHHHHREQHRIGQTSFEAEYHVDLWAYAESLVHRSPDVKMRAYLREHATP